MSSQERARMENEIHGIADEVVEETETFLRSKLERMRECLVNVPTSERETWETAVFLRPALSRDDKLHLQWLRAARYDCYKAASLMLAYFRDKDKWFGSDLLVRRITWDDVRNTNSTLGCFHCTTFLATYPALFQLTELEQSMITSGNLIRLIQNHETKGRSILLARISQWDVLTNPVALTRCMFFIQMTTLEDNPEIQMKPIVSVSDFRGTWTSPPLKVLQFLGTLSEYVDNCHFIAATHVLYDDVNFDRFVRALRPRFKRDVRLRYRFHFGSDLEVDYSLRTFGVYLGDCLNVNSEIGPMSKAGMQEAIHQFKLTDEQWRQAEAPYLHLSSTVALHPNKEDIILGRSKKIAPTWPGNLNFTKVVKEMAFRYVEAKGKARFEKSNIVQEVIHILSVIHHSRFLARKDTHWETVDCAEAQQKVSQALRNEARAIINDRGWVGRG